MYIYILWCQIFIMNSTIVIMFKVHSHFLLLFLVLLKYCILIYIQSKKWLIGLGVCTDRILSTLLHWFNLCWKLIKSTELTEEGLQYFTATLLMNLHRKEKYICIYQNETSFGVIWFHNILSQRNYCKPSSSWNELWIVIQSDNGAPLKKDDLITKLEELSLMSYRNTIWKERDESGYSKPWLSSNILYLSQVFWKNLRLSLPCENLTNRRRTW